MQLGVDTQHVRDVCRRREIDTCEPLDARADRRVDVPARHHDKMRGVGGRRVRAPEIDIRRVDARVEAAARELTKQSVLHGAAREDLAGTQVDLVRHAAYQPWLELCREAPDRVGCTPVVVASRVGERHCNRGDREDHHRDGEERMAHPGESSTQPRLDSRRERARRMFTASAIHTKQLMGHIWRIR